MLLRLRRSRLLPCLACLLALALTACGADPPTPAAPAAPPSTGTATPYPQPPVPTIVNASGQVVGSAAGAGAAAPRELRYRVETGDTLLAIATRFDTTVAAIVQRNNITNPAELRIGTELIIPTTSTVLATTTPIPAATALPTATAAVTATVTASGERVYRVEAGDTIAAIAARFGVSADAIIARNAIKDAAGLQVGQELIIPVSTATATPSPTAPRAGAAPTVRAFATPARTLTYTVQPGDSAFDIAARFGVTVEELAAANGRTVASLGSLQPGETLFIPSAR